MTTKICPKKDTVLRSAQFLEIEDNQSVVGGVLLELKNK